MTIVIYVQLIYVLVFCFVGAILYIMLYFEICERKSILPLIQLRDSKQAMNCVLALDVKSTYESASCLLAKYRGDHLPRTAALQQLFVEAIINQPSDCKLPQYRGFFWTGITSGRGVAGDFGC